MYNDDTEKEHRRFDLHQLEWDITWSYLSEYLPAEGSILEIGAATERYLSRVSNPRFQLMT